MGTTEILTELVIESVKKYIDPMTKLELPTLSVQTAIKTAAEQIEQQQRERVERLEHVYLVAWSIVHANHSTAAVQGDEMDSCNNPDCQSIQDALKELEATDA